MKLHKTKTWYNILPELVNNYNSSKHSTILKVPNDITKKEDYASFLHEER
jgi:hypothetical protein